MTSAGKQISLNNEALGLSESATCGVRLSVLIRLLFECKKGATFEDAKNLILERTRELAGNRSYVSWLASKPSTQHLVGKAEYFVSYTWFGSFLDTIQAVDEHLERLGHSDPFIWIDIAMVDQHTAMEKNIDFDVWSKTFKSNLQSIGKALIVMVPGDKPIAIGRSWCCFEWVCIKQLKIEFEYCVPSSDMVRWIFRMKSGTVGFHDVLDLFASISVERASASKPTDQAEILKLVRKVGVQEVNNIIVSSVGDWLLKVAEHGLALENVGALAKINLLGAKAAVHEALGESDEALQITKQALEGAHSLKLSPEGLIILATCTNNCARLLQGQGDLAAAEGLYREALATRKEVLVEGHADLLQSLNSLAALLQASGRTKEARLLLKEARPLHDLR